MAGKSIHLEVVPIPTPFDNIEIMGNKTDHLFKVENDSITSPTKLSFTFKYESKTNL